MRLPGRLIFLESGFDSESDFCHDGNRRGGDWLFESPVAAGERDLTLCGHGGRDRPAAFDDARDLRGPPAGRSFSRAGDAQILIGMHSGLIGTMPQSSTEAPISGSSGSLSSLMSWCRVCQSRLYRPRPGGHGTALVVFAYRQWPREQPKLMRA